MDRGELHEAVARAVDQAYRDYFGNALWTHDAAAAAIRVVLAEVAQSIERAALRADLSKYEPGLVVALAALAALGEQGTDA